MNVRIRKAFGLISLISITLSGCMSMGAKIIGGTGHPYGGVRCDAQVIKNQRFYDTRSAPPWLVASVDMPFSFIMDTLFLPIDAVALVTKKEIQPIGECG